MEIWLASGSSRRKEILSKVFSDFESYGIDADESMIDGAEVKKSIQAICERKAIAASDTNHDLVIVSDTMLVDPEDPRKAIGKPKNESEAEDILKNLRGKVHTVISSTGLRVNGKWLFFQDSAKVKITNFSNEILDELVSNGSWKGKAGGYDLAGEMSSYAKLEMGSENTVLGIAQKAMDVLLGYSS